MIEQLNTNHMKILASMCDKKHPKLELQTVFFDKKNKTIVATDTRRLIALQVDHGVCGMIHAEIIDFLAKSCTKSKPSNIEVQNSGNYIHFFVVDKPHISIKVMKCAGKYPDWQRVIPANKKAYYERHKDAKTTVCQEGGLLSVKIMTSGIPINNKLVKEIEDYYKYDTFRIHYSKHKDQYSGGFYPPLITNNEFIFTIMPLNIETE